MPENGGRGKMGGGKHQPAGPLLITSGHIRQRTAHRDRSVPLRGLARNPGVAIRTYVHAAPFIQKKKTNNPTPQLKALPEPCDRQKHIVHIYASPCHAGLPWAGAARGICLTARAAARHNFLGKREGRGGSAVQWLPWTGARALAHLR